MHVWIVQGVFEGEPFSSVHMTEKGVLVAAVVDVLDFLGVECKETALDVRNRRLGAYLSDVEQAVPYEWDPAKLREMTRAQLRHTFRKWAALTSGDHSGYDINIEQKTLQP
jgi:hypothetical protein